MSTKQVRYVVTGTVRDEAVLQEYVDWLKDGHVQGVVAGGASSAEVIVLERDADSVIRVESSYIFSSREALQAYFDGPAVALREEGKKLFIDTGKVSFTRKIGEIAFSC